MKASDILIVLNPHAGKKNGREILSSIIMPALEKAGRSFQVVETTSKGFSRSHFQEHTQQMVTELVQSLTPSTTARPAIEGDSVKCAVLTIMVLGGDGTVHEIVNGIVGALKGSLLLHGTYKPRVNLAVVPTGTGNSIATSLGITSANDAVERFLSGTTRPMRVMSVSTRGDPHPPADTSLIVSSGPPSPVPFQEWNVQLYSVVVYSFGLHAATVFDAEGYRYLGNDRFKVSALKNIAALHQYAASLDIYGPVQRYDNTLEQFEQVATNSDSGTDANAASGAGNDSVSLRLPGPFTYLLISKQASLEPGFTPTPLARTSDEWLDILAVQNVGRLAMLKILGGAGNGGVHVQDARVQYLKAKVVELQTLYGGRLCVDGELLEVQGGRVRIEVVNGFLADLFHVFS